MCAAVCPSEVQCEGGCLERIFDEHAISIRDIQLVVSRLARQGGMVGVKMPAESSGRRVAVVGGGPGRARLRNRPSERGHHVTIFDSGARLGGTPDAIIPDGAHCRAPTSRWKRFLTPARRRAASRFTSAAPGPRLQPGRPATAVRGGVSRFGLKPVHIAGPGRRRCRCPQLPAPSEAGPIASAGPRVAVLGGGNTAIDAALTALARGAATCLSSIAARWPKCRPGSSNANGSCRARQSADPDAAARVRDGQQGQAHRPADRGPNWARRMPRGGGGRSSCPTPRASWPWTW